MNNQNIKEKIKNAAEKIPVPDSLSPEEIEKKLAYRQQNSSGYTPIKRRVLAAAGFILFLVAGLGVLPKMINIFQQQPDSMNELVITEEYVASKDSSQDSEKSKPEDYEELCNHINELSEVNVNKDATLSTGEETEDTSSEQNNSFSETDLQVKGIMEADVVKTDGSHIYALSNTTEKGTNYIRVRIFSVKGKEAKKIATIKVKNSSCSEMYLEGKTLILLCSDTVVTEDSNVSENSTEDDYLSCYAYPLHQTTNIRLYDVSTPEKPQQIRHMSQSGHYNTSRVRDGYLYTFSNYYVYDSQLTTKDLEAFVPQAADSFIPANKIKMSNAESAEYMVMTSLKISNPQEFTDSAALLGGGTTQYMNENHIYSVENYYEKSNDRCRITKYTYENGHFTYNGMAKVMGSIYDSYYMHEYNDNFVFVYTNYNTRKDTTTNGLCVLNDKMELIGKIENLGVEEDIYASYFIDNMAYFVTFRNTDPVFAVDISNPKKPTLRSELKLPGFSSYLHSFGENRLIGIGNGSPYNNDTDYVKLSLFSVGENKKLKETDTVFPRQKYATQHYADTNHKCVFVDEERDLVGLMISRSYNDVSGNKNKGEYVVYKEINGTLKEVLSCSLKMDDNESEANIRGLRIGDYFYIVLPQSGKIKVYPMDALQ